MGSERLISLKTHIHTTVEKQSWFACKVTQTKDKIRASFPWVDFFYFYNKIFSFLFRKFVIKKWLEAQKQKESVKTEILWLIIKI